MRVTDRLAARGLQLVSGRALRPPAALAAIAPPSPAPEPMTVVTGEGAVRVHVYRPTTAPGAAPPVYVNFHGGGFVVRHPEFDDHLCRALVVGAGCVVVNVDYDVAPQRPFPVAPRQAYDVVRWAAGEAAAHGWDGSRLAVGGQSAGGNLAAGVCLTARETREVTPLLQVLLYPPLDLATDPGTKVARTAKPLISPGLARIFDGAYVPDPSRRADPLVSPLRAADLTGLPAAVVVTAELDLLRDEADRYAARLAEAGVPVRHRVVPGVDHGFTHGEPVGPVRETLATVTEALRAVWSGSSLTA